MYIYALTYKYNTHSWVSQKDTIYILHFHCNVPIKTNVDNFKILK